MEARGQPQELPGAVARRYAQGPARGSGRQGYRHAAQGHAAQRRRPELGHVPRRRPHADGQHGRRQPRRHALVAAHPQHRAVRGWRGGVLLADQEDGVRLDDDELRAVRHRHYGGGLLLPRREPHGHVPARAAMHDPPLQLSPQQPGRQRGGALAPDRGLSVRAVRKGLDGRHQRAHPRETSTADAGPSGSRAARRA